MRKKVEFKKKVVIETSLIFILACVMALVFSWNEKPTDVFVYIIPSASGVWGAAIIWYLKAVQLENGIKIQLGMIKQLIKLGETDQIGEIKGRAIERVKEKADAIIDEALEPTDIQNY
ncbi:MAG: hypothetical protein ACERKZ_03210 [Lachnotalea sp.]